MIFQLTPDNQQTAADHQVGKMKSEDVSSSGTLKGVKTCHDTPENLALQVGFNKQALGKVLADEVCTAD